MSVAFTLLDDTSKYTSLYPLITDEYLTELTKHPLIPDSREPGSTHFNVLNLVKILTITIIKRLLLKSIQHFFLNEGI